MLISPAWGHGLVHTDTSGGGIALLIILAVVIVLFLGYLGRNKWRRRKLEREAGEE